MRHILIFIMVLNILFFSIPTSAYADYNVWNKLENAVAIKVGCSKAYVNLSEVNIDFGNSNVVPIVENSRCLLPLRFVSESFGADVKWDNENQLVYISFQGKYAVIPLNSNKMTINNADIPLDSPAKMVNDRVFVPIRQLAESLLGKKVFYHDGLIVLSDTDNIFNPNSDNEQISVLQSAFKDNIVKTSYMIYYGKLNDEIIESAKNYKLVILHPHIGDITRNQVQEIRQGVSKNNPNDDVSVLAYISIGEDLRTSNMSYEQMKSDPRFAGDKTGPRVDPRGKLPSGGQPLDIQNPIGNPSKGGNGYASYYLDDNNFDGNPDINKYFNCAFVNAGDPAWFDVVSNMTIDGYDKIPGLKEVLTDDYGRGLGCDGVFLDTIDTCAPNSYTDENSPNQSEFEWTAPGFSSFVERVRSAYPDKYILQNRGLFFFDPRLPHYKYCTRENIDFVMFESYRLDSNPNEDYNLSFFKDNKNAFMPKLMAEANRFDGFRVLSLGYAEGAKGAALKDTLLGKSNSELDTLLTDISETQDIAGFNHYITDSQILLCNDFVKNNTDSNDNIPPTWSSTYNSSVAWPPEPPMPRIGIQKVVPQAEGAMVFWDVAIDKNKVKYKVYYQETPFDFINDPQMTKASQQFLIPEIGDVYKNGVGQDAYPYQAFINNLTKEKTYYFVIRAVDIFNNEDKNEVVLSAPLQ